MSEDEDLGRMVVRQGLLLALRKRLGFPRMLMAEMLYTTIGVYSTWESQPDIKLRSGSADKIGRFYRSAMRQLDDLEHDGIDISTLVPFHLAASHYRIGQEILYKQYRDGELDGVDLGILGLWMYKVDLT